MKLFKDFGIRALFGTLIIAGFLYFFWLAMTRYPQALIIVKDAFVGLITMIVGFYFGQRSVK